MQDLFSRLSLGGKRKAARPLRQVPVVSVVIPCYNYGRFLHQCVDSVRTQQPGIELDIVIVDDCSSDDSLAVARALQATDARIRVIAHHANTGHIATYNDGLTAARGEHVLLLSADDLVAPGALSRAAALLSAEPSIGLVYGRGVDFKGAPPPARGSKPGWIVWRGTDWLRARCRSGYNAVSTPTAVMRTSVLRAIGGYRPELPHAGDFEMWLRTAAVSDIGFISGVDQAFYRWHGTNMNSNQFQVGTDAGALVDLEQRLSSFEAVFSGVGAQLAEAEALLETARRQLACQALGAVNHAYARGKRTFPFEAFAAFARRTYPGIDETPIGRSAARRRRIGLIDLPLHPLWAPGVIAMRFWRAVHRWRHYTVGV